MADNNYTLGLSFNSFGNIAIGTTETQAGTAEVHTFSPAYGLSAVRIQNLSISASNNIGFAVSASRSLPATLTWNGATGQIMTFIVSGNNLATHLADLTGTVHVYASAYGILSAGVTGTIQDGISYSSADTFIALGDHVAPSGVTGFTATAGQTRVRLNWTNPTDIDLSAVRVTFVNGTSTAAPASEAVGVVVYEGALTTAEHTGLTANQTMSYGIFSLDTVGNWSSLTGETSATATTFNASVYGLSEEWPYATDAEITRTLFEEGII